MDIRGETVRLLRRKRGWTQEQLADMTDRNVRTIQRVEKTGVCDMETRSALASVFKVNVAELDQQQKIPLTQPRRDDQPVYQQRVVSGQGIVDISVGADWYRFSNEAARCEDDARYVENVGQTIRAYAEIWNDLEPSEKVQATLELDEIVKKSGTKGFRLFGLRTKENMPVRTLDVSGMPVSIKVCNFHIAYADSNDGCLSES